MRRAVETFAGESPRTSPRLLPDSASQSAINARLLDGDLTAWRHFSTEKNLAGSGPVLTIAKIGPTEWMSWTAEVDVARGITPGDTTYRTYLTAPGFYAQPRFTNLALATTGAEPYPVTTRPLGVPAPDTPPTLAVGVDPNATTFSVNTLDEGNVLSTSWVKSADRGGSTAAIVYQRATAGNPAPCYALQYDEIHNEGEQPYCYRNFGTEAATVVHASVDFMCDRSTDYMQAILQMVSSLAGYGIQIRYQQGLLLIHTSSGWSPYAVAEAARVAAAGVTAGLWYTLTADISTNGDGTKTVVAGLYLGSAQIATVTATVNAAFGNYFGFTNGTGDDAADIYETNYDNLLVQAGGPSGYVPSNLATSYVYTFVNDLAQESAPSLPSNTVLRPDGIAVTVTTPTGIPTGVDTAYGIATKRIYRAVTGSSGTAYQFVAEVPLAQADYIDTLTDSELGEVLPSDNWALPPTDLEGILALPNGVMAGFAKNQLCLSAQNHPHAWPVEYRLNTDTDIVGIANIDTTVVIGTQSFVYIASGNDPANYSMAKFEVPYAAAAKLSFTYLTGLGVVFAGTDGLMAVAGPGQVRNLTERVFTLRQWRALAPSSIRAVAHNDIYWMFYTSVAGEKGCFAIDMKDTGFGVVPMSFHATAAWVDPLTDKLFLVLDSLNEPDDGALPDPPMGVAYTTGTTIFEFEGNSAQSLTYRWRSKLWLLERPATMSVAQVRAGDYDNLVVRYFGDGEELAGSGVVTGQTEYLVGGDDTYRSVEIEITGTSTVRSVQVAEDMLELS